MAGRDPARKSDVSQSTALRAIAPLALMASIFYLSSRESVGPELPAFTRVIAHFTEYALLATLWSWALYPAVGSRSFAVAAAISFAFALSDEFHQSFVPGRDADPFDLLVDGLGIAVAIWLLRARRAAVRRRRSSR
jgi:VanZ family protein